MKDSGEVFENVKEQATQHEAKKRRRNRIGTVAAVLLVVAAVGISVSVYKKTNGGKKQTNNESSASVTPYGETGTPTPTGQATPPENPATPTPTLTEPVVVLPKKTPTPTQPVTPEPTPTGVTKQDIAKIDKELRSLEETADCAEVMIGFGDEKVEGGKLFLERYPQEYCAYWLRRKPWNNWSKKEMEAEGCDECAVRAWEKNERGKLSDEEFNALANRGAILFIQFPGIWCGEQLDLFFEKYPELKENRSQAAKLSEFYHKYVVVTVSYAEMLELAMDSQVESITKCVYSGAVLGEVVGEYNGRDVYDVTVSDESVYFNGSVMPQAGQLETKVMAGEVAVLDDAYLRVAFTLCAHYEVREERILEQYGKSSRDPDWDTWIKSEEGRNAYDTISREITDPGYEKIRSYGWPVLEEGYGGHNVSRICLSGCSDGRYIIVLATKEQLIDFLPELGAQVKYDYAACGPMWETRYDNVDPLCFVSLFWAGQLKASLLDIPFGEPIE
ncbi:MAG: hypothetical protein J6Y20_04065 [Lachnospiraceae bacterium]|nr:hypothetical protein [Lachnospiraceae bacterium]